MKHNGNLFNILCEQTWSKWGKNFWEMLLCLKLEFPHNNNLNLIKKLIILSFYVTTWMCHIFLWFFSDKNSWLNAFVFPFFPFIHIPSTQWQNELIFFLSHSYQNIYPLHNQNSNSFFIQKRIFFLSISFIVFSFLFAHSLLCPKWGKTRKH